MLRLYKQPTVVLNRHRLLKPALYQGLRHSSSINNDYSHKVSALPFKLPEEKVHQIVNIASYVNQHAFFGFFKIVKSIFTKKMPDVKESVESMQVRKAYIPIWYYDIAISADITPTSKNPNDSPDEVAKRLGQARQLLAISFDSFWPGHTWDPVSYLSFGRLTTDQVAKLVPFTPELCEGDVEVLPFTVNPIEDIAARAPAALEHLQVDSANYKGGQYIVEGAQVLFSAAYPIYVPVYVAQFRDRAEEPKTIVIEAHSQDPPLYQWIPKRTGLEQWVNNGSWIQVDVTEPDWRMGFGGQTPLRSLVVRFATEAVGQFQTQSEMAWNDPRIQTYGSYQKQNKDYLQQLFKVWAERNMLSRIESMDENQKTLGFARSSKEQSSSSGLLQVKTVSDLKKEIEGRVADELVKLAELEPEWFKESNKKSTEDTLEIK